PQPQFQPSSLPKSICVHKTISIQLSLSSDHCFPQQSAQIFPQRQLQRSRAAEKEKFQNSVTEAQEVPKVHIGGRGYRRRSGWIRIACLGHILTQSIRYTFVLLECNALEGFGK